MKKSIGITVASLLLVALIWAVVSKRLGSDDAGPSGRSKGAVPVEIAPIEIGTIQHRRQFSGTLEAASEFIVAPKISGRVERLTLDLSDPVSRGQVVAELDGDESEQAVRQSEAELAVAQANVSEAESALVIAQRELQRNESLLERGVASASQRDSVQLNVLAKTSAVEVAKAQAMRAEAALESARIRLSYTRVTANWTDGHDQRLVAQRFVNEGDTVSANTPIMAIVGLNPILAVVYVTEKDYGLLQVGQLVEVTTDAYPKQTFQGRVNRLAPVFEQTSRQARIEIEVDNPDSTLKPGMFIRAGISLGQREQAMIVSINAIANRAGETGVFLVRETTDSDQADQSQQNLASVKWQPVTTGFHQGERVEIISQDHEVLSGQVVTLGQQLLDDGTTIIVPTANKETR